MLMMITIMKIIKFMNDNNVHDDDGDYGSSDNYQCDDNFDGTNNVDDKSQNSNQL